MPPPGRRVGTDLPILRPEVGRTRRRSLQHAEIDHVAAQQHDIVGVAQEPLIDLPFSKLLAGREGFAADPGQKLTPLRQVGRIPVDPAQSHETSHSGYGLALGLLCEEVAED